MGFSGRANGGLVGVLEAHRFDEAGVLRIGEFAARRGPDSPPRTFPASETAGLGRFALDRLMKILAAPDYDLQITMGYDSSQRNHAGSQADAGHFVATGAGCGLGADVC